MIKNDQRLKTYQITVIISILIAVFGFMYNVWRLEHSEHNNNIRIACFELLKLVAEVEQLVYAAHYDNNLEQGNPRMGWVKIGLINDLSVLTNHNTQLSSNFLKVVWSEHWNQMENNRESADKIVESLEKVRSSVKALLITLN